MQQKSKIITLISGTALLFLVILYYSFFTGNNSIWNAIPSGSTIVLQSRLDSLETLPNLYAFRQLREDKKLLSYFDIPANQLFLSVLQSGTPDGLNVLFITEALPDFPTLLVTQFADNIQRSQLQGVEIFQVSSPKMTFAQHKNVLLIAPHALQVEMAIEQLNKRTFQKTSFTKHNNFTTQNRLLVSLENLASFLNPFLQNSFQKQLEHCTDLGEVISTDLQKTDQGFLLNGMLYGKSQLLADDPFSDEKMLVLLPHQTLIYLLGKMPSATIKKMLQPSFQEFVDATWFSGEFAIGNIGFQQKQESSFTILGLKEKGRAGLATMSSEGVADAMQYMMYDAYTLDGKVFFTQHEDYLLIFQSETMLQNWVNQYSAGQTLSSDASFRQLRNPFPANLSGSIYVNSNRLSVLLNPLLEEKWKAEIQDDLNIIGGEGHFLLTFETSEEGIKVQAAATQRVTEKNIPTAEAFPVIELPGKAVGIPKIIKKEGVFLLLIEDEYHRLHAYDEKVELLWTIELEDRILSDIHFIHPEKQSEQLLFNTAFKVHTYDLSGKPVTGFPFELQTKANLGMCLIDFTETERYNYLIPCENGGIYGYDLVGNPLEGWNPKSDLGKKIRSVLHFQNAERDFITVAVDSSIKVFDRLGKLRFPIYKDSMLINAKVDFQSNGNFPRIVAADRSGKVHILNLEGKNFKIPLDGNTSLKPNFVFADVWGDERKDYLEWKNKKLQIFAYAEDGFKIREDIISEYPLDSIFILPYDGKNWIGGISSDVGRVTLYDGNGKRHPAFPLAGDRVFCIHENVVYATESNLLYRYYLN